MKRVIELNNPTINQEKIQWKQLMKRYCKASMIPKVLTRIIPAVILIACWILFELLLAIIVGTRKVKNYLFG